MNNSKNCWSVYCHTTPSGKRYIGITSRKPEKRWRNGNGYNPKFPFGQAIEKYKWENIRHEILDTNLDEFTAKCLEEYYILSYQTYVGFNDCKGYNLTLGGEGNVGWKPTEETRRKLSESGKCRHHTEETKNIISEKHKGEKNSFYGKHHNEETKKIISEKHKGIKLSEEHKRKIGEAGKGRHHTEESKMRMSASLKGKTSGMKGKHHTEETKRKISESRKGKPSPMKGKKTGKHAWNRGIHSSEETRHKQSESLKGKPSPMKGKNTGKPAWNRGLQSPMKGKKTGRPCATKGKHWKLIDGKRVYYE